MERLDLTDKTAYNAIEASIHLNRYGMARPFCNGAKVLDAACGQGYGSYLMKMWGAKSVDGIDINEEAIDCAKSLFKDENLTYHQQDVQQLPFSDNTFDLIVSLETIEHVNDPEEFLREIKRILKPGGIIILSCPNDQYYFERDNMENLFHKNRYNFFEFKELSEKYLGSYVEYYLGFALDGFINLPYERRTEPEQSVKEDALGLFHYTECDQTFCIPQERYLNQWNCNYYIGIWGKAEKACRYNAVIAPRETFIEHKDKDYDLLHHLDEIETELKHTKELLAAAEYECNKLERQINGNPDSISVELDRVRTLLELTTKERDLCQLHMNEKWNYYRKALEEKEENWDDYQKALRERDENWEFYQNALSERNKAMLDYEYANQQLNSVYNSLTFRLLRKFDSFCVLIKRMFRLSK